MIKNNQNTSYIDSYNNNFWVRILLIISGVLLLSACNHGDIADLKVFVQETKAKYKPDIEPPPTIPNFPTFRYAGHDLREPFVAAEGEDVEDSEDEFDESTIRPDRYRRKEELESFPLDALRMVGTLRQGEDVQTWGLIKAPDGTIHRVKPGNYMGLNHGKIVNVLEERIELMEIVPRPIGGWQERDAIVALSGIEE